MKKDFKNWLIEEYGLQENAASSRTSNISTIEKYYGDIDEIIKAGKVYDLLRDLSYSTNDERNGNPPAHIIPIDGNIRTGSATLKQALNRYVEYYEAINGAIATSSFEEIFNNLKEILHSFQPIKNQTSYSSKVEVCEYIQEPILNLLKSAMPNVDWNMEFQISSNVEDNIDIIGTIDEDSTIIIDFNDYSVDQICKKFVSRQARTDDMNTIYIVLTYPYNNCVLESEKQSLMKYAKYLKILTEHLGAGSNLEKYYYIYNLL